MKDLKRSLSIVVYLDEIEYQCLCIEDCYQNIQKALFNLKEAEKRQFDVSAQVFHGVKNPSELAKVIAEAMEKNEKPPFRIPTKEEFNQFQKVSKERETSVRQVHRYVKYLINHAGMISSFIFPFGATKDESRSSRKAQRGKLIRTITKTSSASPLANRALRNCYQHYDERLDTILEYADGYDHRNVSSSPLLLHEESASFVFDPKSEKIYYPKRSGYDREEFDLEALISETSRIKNLAREILKKIGDYSWNGKKEKVKEYINKLIETSN